MIWQPYLEAHGSTLTVLITQNNNYFSFGKYCSIRGKKKTFFFWGLLCVRNWQIHKYYLIQYSQQLYKIGVIVVLSFIGEETGARKN